MDLIPGSTVHASPTRAVVGAVRIPSLTAGAMEPAHRGSDSQRFPRHGDVPE